MRFVSYFNTALQLILAYNGSMPLAHYLKQYFAQHKKHGSKDRKYISHACYCYYRLGQALTTIPTEERLKAALFLCTDDISEWNMLFDEAWLRSHSPLLNARIAFIQSTFHFAITDIFPWQDDLSAGIDAAGFALSHLTQPNLFLRIRPGKKNVVVQKLQAQNIPVTDLGHDAVALPNATKVESIIELNKEAVVQDYSSQQVKTLFPLILQTGNTPLKVWDCCAASGGKSILAHDNLKNIRLTVSDIRASIISNLRQRFSEAVITNYKSFVADASLPQTGALEKYNLVICDAPCTGSGTWARTPEQLYFFSHEKINHYSALQQKITSAIIPYIDKGGYLLYITCSVFKGENEAIVETLVKEHALTLIESKAIPGYGAKADTMFAALFHN